MMTKANKFHITYASGLEEDEHIDLPDAEAVANQKFGLSLAEVEERGAKIELLPAEEEVDAPVSIEDQDDDNPETLKIN